MMAYERALHTPNATAKALGDGSLRIPERANGYPDWLDEAKWEMVRLMNQLPEPTYTSRVEKQARRLIQLTLHLHFFLYPSFFSPNALSRIS